MKSVPSVVQKIAAYARLLRLSNAPTAVADVWMGYAVTTGDLQPSAPLAIACGASFLAYHGGMALNDARDADTDTADGRGRPIEQGHFTKQQALVIAACFLAGSMLMSLWLAWWVEDRRPIAIGPVLVAFVVAYNSRLKRTWLGPLLMGFCRVANVLLGLLAMPLLSLKGTPTEEAGVLTALAVGVYTAGVTWYARDEATAAKRLPLVLGSSVSWIGLVLAGVASAGNRTLYEHGWERLSIIWTVVAMFCTRGMVAAIIQPTPRNIGRGVGIAIQGIIVIDATLATLYAGPMAGLAIFALLPVTMLLSRWIPQT